MTFKSFIITFKDSVPEADASKIKNSISSLGGTIVHDYSLIKGFAVKLPESLKIDKLKDLHGDAFETIEEDKEVKAL
ncbi:Pbi2 [Kluyveromyces lactis]|uniref:KLLA0E08867p n=1 Tax=Kluyveromyces lactis (strain ATCC 8585 / CBS 2359 / DSM 70799 / NBRC 1267 / NRRL Y-1140 / WM37) TaxID=284590 RepID=Q6CNZ0_KLULA|nr:uncharacterized protein KLLA0_E08867g [Kluyveromyces lactis]QEU62731.1 Pbi2 [Kluyveromyces lactis]CAG99436.1 KLLA0E08867p [Kluyveromyces lactis]|eukprot:XP_454349.1 uncharacterized protein KLLA0_E08867g [Kluyveromyces lactis]